MGSESTQRSWSIWPSGSIRPPANRPSTNFFRRIAAPLDELRNSATTFELTSLQKKCFDSLKTLTAQAPILAFPDFEKPFYVATDASNVGIGAVIPTTSRAGPS